MRLVLGVDSSTQSTKVEARKIDTGELVASGKAPHPLTQPPSSEQDPRSWWAALVDAVGQLGDYRNMVVAMSVAGQQHGLVLLDDKNEPVRPAKLWNDTTSSRQAENLVSSFGPDKWAQACGSVPVASFTITKLGWIAQNEPESLARTARVMLPHDYLTFRLSGKHVTDRGDASGTGWFNPTEHEYKAELLASVLPRADDFLAKLPRVLTARQAAGELQDSAAKELGLSPGILIGPGTGDNMAAALGLGLKPGDVALSLGTSGTVYSVSESPTADSSGLVAGFADASGRYLPLACTLNATKVTDTVARWLGTDAQGLSNLAMQATMEPDGVILIPHFDGERTPNLPNATGSFYGLRNSTTREVIARAAHDGVLCGLFFGLDALASSGVDTSGTLNLVGGGSRSAAYRQRCADLRGEPVLVPSSDEVVATGAALQAAGICDDQSFSELAARWSLGSGTLTEPQPGADGIQLWQHFSALLAS